jgi:hypothetical protein
MTTKLKLFLHIGYPKTGTTALQAFLANNDEALAKQGILYPKTGRIGNAHYGISFSLGLGDYTGEQHKISSPQELRAQLLEEVYQSGVDRVAISSEYFSTARPMEKVHDLAKIQDFFRDFEVYPVVFLRRHDYAFESAYSQNVKMMIDPRWDSTIESFILCQMYGGTFSYNYFVVLRRWAAAFGTDRVMARPYEKADGRSDVCSEFLKIMGVAGQENFIPPSRDRNASISHKILCVMDQVLRSHLTVDVKRKVIGALAQMSSHYPRQENETLIRPSIRKVLVSNYVPSYRAIAREFLPNGGVEFFNEAIPTGEEEWLPPLPPSNAETIEILVRALTAPVASGRKKSGGNAV